MILRVIATLIIVDNFGRNAAHDIQVPMAMIDRAGEAIRDWMKANDMEEDFCDIVINENIAGNLKLSQALRPFQTI